MHIRFTPKKHGVIDMTNLNDCSGFILGQLGFMITKEDGRFILSLEDDEGDTDFILNEKEYKSLINELKCYLNNYCECRYDHRYD